MGMLDTRTEQLIASELLERIRSLGLFGARFRVRLLEPMTLPGAPGPTLRGALGHALFAHACPYSQPRCSDCAYAADCAHAVMYTSPTEGEGERRFAQPPHPAWVRWAFRPAVSTPAGTELEVLWIGTSPARPLWSQVAWSMRRLCEEGLGPRRSRLELLTMTDAMSGALLSANGSIPDVQWQPGRWCAPEASGFCELSSISALRIYRDGRLISTPHGGDVIAGLLRRLSMLELASGSRPKETTRSVQYGLIDLGRERCAGPQGALASSRRVSGRSGQLQSFVGFEGRLIFKNLPVSLRILLDFGQWSGLGKGIAMGFGAYSLSFRE